MRSPVFPHALPGLALALLLPLATAGSNGAFPGGAWDTDGYMHLLRAQDVLAGGWNGGVVARDNAPWGALLHWTAPFDVLLLPFVALAAALGLDPSGTATLAAAVGPLGLVLFSLAAAWTAGAASRGPAVAVASMAAVLAPNALAMGDLGRVDHHLLVASAALFAAGCALRAAFSADGGRWALAAGAVGGFAMWCSVEALPGAVLADGLLLLAWARGRLPLAAVARYRAAWAAAVAAALVADPTLPLAQWDYDRLSLGFLLLPCLLAAAAAAGRLGRAAGLAASAAAAAAWLALFPALLLGARAVVGDELMLLWWSGISELAPADTPVELAFWVGPAILAAAAYGAVLAADRRRPWAASGALYLAALVVLAAAAAQHIRFGLLAAAFAAPALGWAFERGAELLRPRGRLLACAALPFALLAPLLSPALLPADNAAPPAPAPGGSCSVRAVEAAFGPSGPLPPGAVVMAEIDLSPELLYRSGVLTVAGPYQRNREGLLDVFRFMRGSDEDEAREALRRRGVGRVLVCGSGGNAGYDGGELSLYRRLVDGRQPGWLVPLDWPPGTKTGLRLFAVKLGP